MTTASPLLYPLAPAAPRAVPHHRVDIDISAVAAPVPCVRDASFDAARLLASFAIVWCHTPRSALLVRTIPFGVSATSFFAAAALFFLVRSLQRDPTRTFSQYARARVQRLALPFYAWTTIYLLFRDCCRVFLEHQSTLPLSFSTLLLGSELQLWFLPFLLITGLIAFPIVRVAVQSPRSRTSTACAGALAGLVIICLPRPVFSGSADWIHFQNCVWFVTPCTLWGIAAALEFDRLARFRTGATALAGAALTLACCATIPFTGNTIWAKNLGGLGWLMVSLALPDHRLCRKLAPFAPLAFGVYLAHPLILGLLRAGASFLHLVQLPVLDLVFFPLAIGGSVLLTRALRRFPQSRWLTP